MPIFLLVFSMELCFVFLRSFVSGFKVVIALVKKTLITPQLGIYYGGVVNPLGVIN